jgi:catechol 2,3-dioxygenase-like lactoylglutathione lyase family enzyme
VTTPPALGIRHVALLCMDLPAVERFSRDVLGFRVVWRPSEHDVYLTSGTDNLALHVAPGLSVAMESRLDHLGILVAEPGDVDRWAEHLRAHQVEPEAAPRDHRDGSRSFHVRDPEGNRVQIIHIPSGPPQRS